jgi:HSP20 family protein
MLPDIARWDPFRGMREKVRDMFRWDPFREMAERALLPERRRFAPDFEVKETADAFLFRADLPGVKEEDLDISFTGNRITISGKREEEEREEGERYYAYERSYGAFSRIFTLPEGADPDNAKAEFSEGVLTLRVPKVEGVKAKKIPIGEKKEPAKA